MVTQLEGVQWASNTSGHMMREVVNKHSSAIFTTALEDAMPNVKAFTQIAFCKHMFDLPHFTQFFYILDSLGVFTYYRFVQNKWLRQLV